MQNRSHRTWCLAAGLALLIALAAGCSDDDDGATTPSNHAPEITSLTVVPDSVIVSQTAAVTCVASDEDGDSLQFAWLASAGSFAGDSASVIWTAPAVTGGVALRVTVSDGRGREAQDSAQVVVVEVPDQPPVIDSLTADSPVTSPLGEVTLTCAAHDPEGGALDYVWSASAGGLSGSGTGVVWTAPDAEGIYSIEVAVTDSEEQTVTATYALDVIVGVLLVQSRDGIMVVDFQGNMFTFAATTRSVEVLGTRIFSSTYNGMTEYDQNGNVIATITSSEPDSTGELVVLPDGGYALISNRYDEIYFNAADGTFLETVAMPTLSPSELQNTDGVVVGDRLIVSETGNNELIAIDLETRAASVFRTISSSGWLGAIDEEGGDYFLCRSMELNTFTEAGAVETLAQFGEGNLTGVVAVGSYAYVVVNFEGTLYRVHRVTGEKTLMRDDLDYPQDIEFLPTVILR